ncbi:MAG: V-type ATP synthase subunit I [Clostridium sp.]
MAIVKMNKFTLLTFKSQKENLLKNLQKFQEVEFINLSDKDSEEYGNIFKDSESIKVSELQGDLAKVNFSLEYLNKYRGKPSTIKQLKEGKQTLTHESLETNVKDSKWLETYEFLKVKESRILAIKNMKSKINSEREILRPWLNFDASFSDLKKLNWCVSFIGTIPKNLKDEFLEKFTNEISQSYVELVEEIKGELGIIVIVHKELNEKASEILKSFVFSKANIGYEGNPREIIKEFGNEISILNKEERDIEADISSISKVADKLELVYEYISNEIIKHEASGNFLNTSNISIIEGWVPRNEKEKLQKVIEETLGADFYFEMEEAEESDVDEYEIPVKLKNNPVAESFESITEMYSLPHYSEIDPTPLLTPFYLLFFGMMVADVGYAAVMFIASFLALKLFNLDEEKKKFIKFFLYLSIPTALVGAVYGSYFGDSLSRFGVRGLIDPGNDVITILISAMAFGLIQLFVGLAIKGYMFIREGKYLDAIYDTCSWYSAIIGGIILFANYQMGTLPSGLVTTGKWMMILGMVAIVLTQGRASKNVGGKIGGGLYSLYGITNYVGDLVSYSRLMALGLSGGSIASAFNVMIGYLPEGISRIVLGGIIFVAAHLFNLLLGGLGAYVHTCRLQYVEYFSKFYVGGGRAFKPFKFKNKYINIKDN